MDKLVRSFTDYIQETLGITVKPQSWEGCRSLPVFMHSMYDCYVSCILGEQCLLLVSREGEKPAPAAIRKHYEIARQKWPGAVIVVKQAIASNSRQRMIEYKIPFAVPGNQLYLPDAGLDIREHFRRIRDARRPFSPATQVVVLRALLEGSYGPLTSTQLVGTLHYTPMTIKRAFDEIEQAQIGAADMRGRERELRFERTGRELWDAALPFLRDPVQRRVMAMLPPDAATGLEAGLSALSRYSMISAPIVLTTAISSGGWKAVSANPDVREIAYEDEGAHRLEIWRYDPTPLSTIDMVDRLSLFLSLRDSSDERIEAALDEMMEGMQW